MQYKKKNKQLFEKRLKNLTGINACFNDLKAKIDNRQMNIRDSKGNVEGRLIDRRKKEREWF